MSVIFERRSVRNLLPKPVEAEKIDLILRAGFEPPSAHNSRPWEFLVIRERDGLDALAGMSPYSKMCAQAAAAIVSCASLELAGAEEDWWVQDLSAVTENILLQIVEEGLGGVWLGWYPDKSRTAALKARFGLPPRVVPFSVVALGYDANPAAGRSGVSRFDASKVHYGAWSGR
jgi:nitroreductase